MLELNVEKTLKRNKISFNYNMKTKSKRVAILGPSGSGKTTLLKMIAGFCDPDIGIIKVNDKIFFNKRKKLPVFKRKIGYIPQEYTLFPHMSVKNNILYGIKRSKLHFDKEKFIKLINNFEIEDKMDCYPHELSGGEKQRVALARALMVNPDILLLDEPFSALDKITKDNLREAVLDILEHSDTRAIFVTHDFEDAYDFANEIFIVFNGKIIEHGDKEKLFNNPTYLETAKILNFKNIWSKKVCYDFFKKLNINVEILSSNKTTHIGIKPENILVYSKLQDKLKPNSRITKIKKYGSFSEIHIESGNLNIVSIKPNTFLLENTVKEREEIFVSITENSLVPLKKFHSCKTYYKPRKF